ncbi:hypothetical protein F5Y17DRAFT_411672 [Xylariaceae sp. FL0594]|nr:hypothetical protein F5Y17DRAFT_411672 [Xylariaceae sp. FL0594]
MFFPSINKKKLAKLTAGSRPPPVMPCTFSLPCLLYHLVNTITDRIRNTVCARVAGRLIFFLLQKRRRYPWFAGIWLPNSKFCSVLLCSGFVQAEAFFVACICCCIFLFHFPVPLTLTLG